MVTSSKPYETKSSDLNPNWHVVDAEGQTLGRLASQIAAILNGKHNPLYVPHLLTGDYVIVLNADKIRVTGNKMSQKMYYRHSGYHGGLTERTMEQVMDRHPDRVIRQAVKGMLPKNSLGRKMLKRLKIYTGTSHPHEAQVSAGKGA
ncbi:MAG: 50S ribosomal protein L13 [Dehalococcoidia bacterium]|nr:50S ribosomal protein L13 [Dehalococcoidia bacterium]